MEWLGGSLFELYPHDERALWQDRGASAVGAAVRRQVSLQAKLAGMVSSFLLIVLFNLDQKEVLQRGAWRQKVVFLKFGTWNVWLDKETL